MQRIRTWQDIEKLAEAEGKTPKEWLTPAERELIRCAVEGEECVRAEGEAPPEGDPNPDVHIRANVLRYMLLGGCETKRCDVDSVQLKGAHITGHLILNYQTIPGNVILENCRVVDEMQMLHSTVNLLSFPGCFITDLLAQGIHVKGGCYLREITCSGTIDLTSATIEGQLDFSDTKILSNSEFSLNAQRLVAKEDVMLEGIFVQSTVRLIGAEIHGDIYCTDARFFSENSIALFAQSIRCHGALMWENVTTKGGRIDLTNSKVGTLADSPSDWPTDIDLDHFVYDQIISATTDPKSRLPWLESGDTINNTFTPQPYSHFANVLEGMGRSADAREIRYHRDRKIAMVNFETREGISRWVMGAWNILRHGVVGYGHKPLWPFGWMIVLIALTAWPATLAWNAGDMAPNSDVVLTSDAWAKIEAHEAMPGNVWAANSLPQSNAVIGTFDATQDISDWHTKAPGRDWESFNAIAFGIDVVIPIVNFGQTDAWAPSTTRGYWGKFMFYLRWIMMALGWTVTALAAAAITGIMQRK